jgi:hypothetical protein
MDFQLFNTLWVVLPSPGAHHLVTEEQRGVKVCGAVLLPAATVAAMADRKIHKFIF